MTLDRNRPVQTRKGEPVRIVTWTEGSKTFPIIGFIGDKNTPDSWTAEGTFLNRSFDDNYDLVNGPERKVTWSRIWRRGPSSQAYSSPDEALATVSRKSNLVGLLKITWEDDKPISVELEEV